MVNPEKYLGTKLFDQLIGGHRQWLNSFSSELCDKWDNLFQKNNSEAALCEAATRQMLEELDVDVEPFDTGGNERKPDFKCTKNQQNFYVEATCITTDVATEKSGLEEFPENGKTTSYGLMTKTIFQEACSKAPQCSNLEAPCLLVIGTWHFNACQLCFDEMGAEEILTSAPCITISINNETEGPIGNSYESTDLRWSAFVRLSKTKNNHIEIARSPISAILICPFGAPPIVVLGALHPNPNYPFNRNIFPSIKFCKLADEWENGCFKVEWF